VMSGKYGPYVKWGKVNATIPKDVEPEKVTMDMAVALIVEKVPAKKKSAAKKKPTTKKAPAKKKDKPKA
jgi:DNA topoisomerase-1